MPPDKQNGRAPTPDRSMTPDALSLQRACVVVDLAAERRRRLLRDLRLGPTVVVPCGPGPCRCYGSQLGRGAS